MHVSEINEESSMWLQCSMGAIYCIEHDNWLIWNWLVKAKNMYMITVTVSESYLCSEENKSGDLVLGCDDS